jgi:mono/diheme cytochrome c family protein
MRKGIWIAAVAAVLVLAWSPASAAKPGNAAKGKDVFESNCAVCHNADSTEKKMGPGLKGVAQKPALVNKKKPTDGNLLMMINKGTESGMPGWEDKLSDQERADVVAYLKTL